MLIFVVSTIKISGIVVLFDADQSQFNTIEQYLASVYV